MIRSCRDRETEKVFRGFPSRKFQRIQDRAEERLAQLHAAMNLMDLSIASMRLEKLSRDRKGQYSIRVNDQYRICFEWRNGNAYEVEIVDTREVEMKNAKRRPPVHPGRILAGELGELGLSANAMALALRIPANRLTEIINGKRGISADTAMRLARYFGTSAQMWMNLQSHYELEVAEDDLAERIAREVQPLKQAS